jgi:hypothetical protein
VEYFIGSLATLLAVIAVSRITRGHEPTKINLQPKVSQSHSFELLMPYIDRLIPNANIRYRLGLETQSQKHFMSKTIKMIIHGDNAYWIHDSLFYTAKLVGGVLDKNTTELVDTMKMNSVELKEISNIVEKLTEEIGNDNSNSGN